MIFQCSGVELDTTRYTVTSAGEPVSVTPKVFDLLVFLMQNRNRLITREELFEALWPDRVVLDNVLSNDIKQARAVLGDDGEQQKFIKTIRGRGYEFVGEVRELELPASEISEPPNASVLPEAGATTSIAGSADSESAATATPAATTSALRPLSLLLTIALFLGIAIIYLWSGPSPETGKTASVPADQNGITQPIDPEADTIAILPFQNRSNLEQDAFFVDGFHDDLITQISRIKDLSTISRTSVMAYRDSTKSMRAIGGELGATIIIEGGVQRSGDQVRINVQMIDAQDDAHIWAETYTRQLNAQNVFEIQSEIALAVASTLRTVLTQQEQQGIAQVPTENIAALEAFFRGRVSMALITSSGFSEAVNYFRTAVDLDPDFAEAHAQLGLALIQELSYSSARLDENMAQAEASIDRALGLNPDLSEAYEALALFERNRGNVDAVEAAYERALELKPGNADAIRMFAIFKSWARNQHDEALALLNAVKFLDPQNPETLTFTSHVLVAMQRHEEALEILKSVQASAPNFAETYRQLGNLYQEKFYQHDEAIAAYRRFQLLDPDTPWNFIHLGTAYEEIGLKAEAVRLYEVYLGTGQTWVWPNIARIRMHIALDEPAAAEREFAEIKAKYDGDADWVDAMLSEHDIEQGNPAAAIARVDAFYPDLVSADLDGLSPEKFNLIIAYATALQLSGKQDQATPLIARILEALPKRPRHRWHGYGTRDTWLYVALGEDEKAIQSLRDWYALGGRLDLTQHRMVPASLYDHPEFQALNKQILDELAEQRANLARMEAAGELAPMPKLSAL